MRPRRSRFVRIYHRLTRRRPNRRAQWQEIATLRTHGSIGHPARSSRSRVYVPEESASLEPAYLSQHPDPPEGPEYLDLSSESQPAADSASGSGVAVAALTAALFLLACAYAGFSGYVHAYDDSFAYLGILGAIGCLVAAGVGICLAASGLRRRYSGRFLSACAISLAALYGMLLFFAAGR